MNVTTPNSFRTGPDENGLFGIYGGRFVAETLMPLILELEQAWRSVKSQHVVSHLAPDQLAMSSGWLASSIERSASSKARSNKRSITPCSCMGPSGVAARPRFGARWWTTLRSIPGSAMRPRRTRPSRR